MRPYLQRCNLTHYNFDIVVDVKGHLYDMSYFLAKCNIPKQEAFQLLLIKNADNILTNKRMKE